MKVFITSALPYVNNVPHLGNIIGSTLSGDIYARYLRTLGKEVIYLCGTDEYGSTTTIRAMQEKIGCKELCEKYNELHKEIYDWFNISFDVWGKTSTESQTEITHEIFNGLYENNYIEEKTINMMYCSTCNLFLADRYIKGICYHPECKDLNSISNGDQCDNCQRLVDVDLLIKPFCSVCKETPIKKDTKHLFLKLDLLGNKIREHLENPENNFSSQVYSIANSWLEKGLTGRCITRDLSWGTPVPLKDFENKVFYVWFDAPIGYYSILAEKKQDWREWLHGTEWVATQAKDNVPFHTIVFPGSILGSGINLPLPNKICCANYLMYEGQKFSKSNKIGIFGDEVIKISNELGINEDYWRFYLIKIRPENNDSSFTLSDFVQTIQSDLINNIGNFINRSFVLAKKYFAGKVSGNYSSVNLPEFMNRYNSTMEKFKFQKALKICLEISAHGNKFLQDNKPWEKKETAEPTIFHSLLICQFLMQLLEPFIPASSQKIMSQIQISHTEEKVVINIMGEVKPLFKKIELNDIQKSLKKIKIDG